MKDKYKEWAKFKARCIFASDADEEAHMITFMRGFNASEIANDPDSKLSHADQMLKASNHHLLRAIAYLGTACELYMKQNTPLGDHESLQCYNSALFANLANNQIKQRMNTIKKLEEDEH